MKNSTKLYNDMVRNNARLVIAMQFNEPSEMLKIVKTSINTLNEISNDIIGNMEIEECTDLPVHVSKKQGGNNVNGAYYNLPAHTSTKELLERMSIQIGDRLFTIKDVLELDSIKSTSSKNQEQGSNRLGGFFVFEYTL